ncbi:MAG TPA: aminoglycoside adenylyltransferase domain-containing protein [Nocardioides sp.]|uniref:aminoglycoside adenylyltransferase domain-containing protein n=1 Tax=Nocardioides sp. TaxID=35761 RepID=UPI002F3E8311
MTLPAPVEAVCTTFLSAVPEGLVSGLYLHGGLAFGEWVEGKSDVDFTATLACRASSDDVAALRAAHEIVAATHGDAPMLDGVHVLASDLARHPDECPDRPTVFMHTFEAAGRFSLSPVSWHELARHGVTVSGPPVESLGIWTDDDALRAHTIHNLDTYWRRHAEACAADPGGASVPFACEWVVPGVARLHHLLVTGEQTSKSRAARWGLSYYPERFRRVLHESLRIREGAAEPQYDDVLERGRDVAAFAAYVVEEGVSLPWRE